MKQFIIILTISILSSCTSEKEVKLNSLSQSEKIEFESPNLFPEGIAYWQEKDKIILGSYGDGNIYEYNSQKNEVSIFIQDTAMIGPASIMIDNGTNIMYVANGDAGVSKRSSKKSTNRTASVLMYDLKTKKRIQKINLEPLYKDSLAIANGLILDDEKNIYITDSYRPVIYKINGKTLEPSIFVEDKRFSGTAFNLNGITYHPNGYLLVLQMGTGKLFKIDIKTKEVTIVKLQEKLIGADGISIVNENQILLTQAYEIENESYTTGAIKTLQSFDDWNTSTLTDRITSNCLNPTNSIRVNNAFYAINSSIGAYQFQGKDQNKFSFIKLKLTPYNNVYKKLPK